MMLLDVNVLLYAFWPAFDLHDQMRAWLIEACNGKQTVLLPDAVLSGFIRIVTGGKAVTVPEPLANAVAFCERLLQAPACRLAHPDREHWRLFIDLCGRSNAAGNLVSDAYLAAMAIEAGAELITCDRDFGAFEGLRFRHPLDEAGA